MEFCKAGHHVVGVDVDLNKIRELQSGSSYIGDVPSAEVAAAVSRGLFCPTTEYGPLAQVEAISICVPTPLRKTREPDVSFVVSVAEGIVNVLQRGQTVILESTVYPGCTDELVKPILERTGLKAGEDFYLAFSPERVDPGNRQHQLRDIPKLVGGINTISTEKSADFYRRVFKTVLTLSSAKEAEMAKLLENTFRAVNIGLVNELATMSHQMGIDFWQVVDAAATKPYGFMPFYPGPGWGGHCIPIDPFYLSWKAKADGLETGFIDHAGHINDRMPIYVVQRISHLLNEHRKCIKDANILLLGVAYKRDVGDIRESPALTVLDLLERDGAQVSYHDPYIAAFQHLGREWKSQPLDAELLRRQDCVVIVTDHTCFDYSSIVRDSQLVFDTRNAIRRACPELVEWVRSGQPHVEVL
jgi:UDP-N-acetyl-D-glucosamine dehydrogenase